MSTSTKALTNLTEMNVRGFAQYSGQGILLNGLSTSQQHDMSGAAWWPYPLLSKLDFEMSLSFSSNTTVSPLTRNTVPNGSLVVLFQNIAPRYVGNSLVRVASGQEEENPTQLAIHLDMGNSTSEPRLLHGPVTPRLGGCRLAMECYQESGRERLTESYLPGSRVMDLMEGRNQTLRICYDSESELMTVLLNEGTPNETVIKHHWVNSHLAQVLNTCRGRCHVGVAAGGAATQFHLLSFQMRGITAI